MALTDKLTAIADQLRSLLGTQEKISLQQMPGQIGQVYEKGEDAFWEKVPKGMDRYHFAGDGWNVDTFYPRGRYTCASGNPQYLFAYHNRRHAPYDLAQRIAACGAEFVFTGATKMDYAFFQANITTVPAMDLAHMTKLQSLFSGCSALHTVYGLVLGENTEFAQVFAGCTALENLTIAGTIGQNGFDVSECPLTRQSLLTILAALKPGANKTLTLGEANLAKLTDSEKAVATDKGWTLQ